LSRWTPSAAYASRLLDARLSEIHLSPPDRRLASELIHGIVRRRATLDALLRPHLRRPLADVEFGLQVLLHLGAYQLTFLSSVPARAAVYETAELAKRIGQPRWTGFVNGVLRALARTLTDETRPSPAADGVPVADGVYRAVESAPFPDPARDLAGYFAAAFSFPEWLVYRWSSRFDRESLLKLGFWFNAPPRLSLRVNGLRATRDQLLERLSTAGIEARPGRHPMSVWIEDSIRVPEIPGFAEGWFAVQDETAIQAAQRLAPQPGERVLDMCAAPGGKTAHLAALMQNRGTILSADVDPARLALIDDTCRRLGVTNVETRLIDREGETLPSGPFDAILIDVPCSNTGVMARRAEVRWRLRPNDIGELAELQHRLLRSALNQLSPTGRVVYSTCSIEPEENRGVVDAVLRTAPEWRMICEDEHLPGNPADGGYQALIAK
jgi:16S rRNA (cytosine967-C5)-methyltransferase